MIKRCLSFLIIMLLLLNVSAVSAAAKPTPVPLFITLDNGSTQNGDVYAWRNPGISRKSTTGYASNPMISPDGQWLAYTSVPSFFIRQRPKADQHTPPEDIFLLNIATNKTIPIASQLPKASLKDGQVIYTLRSTPSWSPDGSELAWTEITTNQVAGTNTDLQTEQLVVYDIQAKSTRVIVKQLPDHNFVSDNPELSAVSWGAGGIAVGVIPPDVIAVVIYVYDANGRLLCQSGQVTAQSFIISQLIWIKDGDKDYVSSVGGGAKIDPLTGEILDMVGVPEMYNPSAPDGYHISYSDDSGGEGNTNWQVTLNGRVVRVLDSVRIATIWDAVISPDGKYIVYIDYVGQGGIGTAVYFKGSDVVVPIRTPRPGIQIAWSAPAWRVFYPASAFF